MFNQNLNAMKKLLVLLVFMTTCLIGCAEAQTATTDDDNYKLYETTNIWTFLKLDTRTGKIWQVQYSTKGPEYRFESVLNGEDLTNGNTKPGKFELYKTQNMYNFILLDKVSGKTWQVQWGDEDARMVLRIY